VPEIKAVRFDPAVVQLELKKVAKEKAEADLKKATSK
jgi:hypothetical protein